MQVVLEGSVVELMQQSPLEACDNEGCLCPSFPSSHGYLMNHNNQLISCGKALYTLCTTLHTLARTIAAHGSAPQ